MQTNDQIYYTLGLLGYTGTIDDRIYKYLGDQGYLGALNDRLRRFFFSLGYVGTFTDQYAQWRESGYVLFEPSLLFVNGEVGTWYDPSDYSTLFQNALGNTPVTAIEQPVGLMLDKSKGLVIGSELVTNGDFSDGSTDWTLTAVAPSTASISSGQLTLYRDAASGVDPYATNVGTAVSGKWYKVEFTVISASNLANNIGIMFGASTVFPFTSLGSIGKKSVFILAPASGAISVRHGGAGPSTIVVDNISVKEIAGNHAYTPSTASTSRPTLSARYNLLLATATLATQSVTVTAGDHTLYFTGAGSITLSGTGSGTYNAGTHTITTTAGTLTLTVTGSVLTADLRRANDGVGLPAYQAVVTASNYDASSLWPPFLRFDGSDDYMLTNSIDFTGTDKILVSAPVRKLSDATSGVFLELGNDLASGVFTLQAPDSSTFLYRWLSRGSAATQVRLSGSNYAAPQSSILTCIGDIGNDICLIRFNGTQAAISTADQGTGTYRNQILYIGRRGGTTLPFSGRLYGLVTRAGTSTESEITNLEAWFNSKAKIY